MNIIKILVIKEYLNQILVFNFNKRFSKFLDNNNN
jgi:hypothetical protein